MKLEIYDDTKPVTKPPVFLRLKKCPDGIEVVAVDDTGNTIDQGHLVRFTKCGRIHMLNSVLSSLGFDLTLTTKQIKIQ